MQVNYEISLFTPTRDETKFCADLYRDGKRIFCGPGGDSQELALLRATNELHLSLAREENPSMAPEIPISDIDTLIRINGMTFEEYGNHPEIVRADAIAAGVKGESYLHYQSKKGQFTGKTRTKYKPLNNMDLYRFAKSKYVRNPVNGT